MKRSTILYPLLAALLLAPTARPCGPYFPEAYVWQDTGDLLLNMPEAHLYSELAFHYGTASPDVYADTPEPTPSTQLGVEISQLKEGLTAQGVPEDRVGELCWAYGQLRSVTRAFHYAKRQDTLADGWFGRYEEVDGQTPPEAPQRFHWAVFAPLAAALPQEFALYAEGATYYHLGYLEEAAARWEALLALPEAERQYRSVWAALMLGKARLILDPPQAMPAFEQARALAEAGFPDPLGLTTASLGWQARAEAQTGLYTEAIHHYVEQFQQGTQEERWSSHLSLDFACGRLFETGYPIEKVVADPLCREVVTLWVLSGRSDYLARDAWTAALVASPPEAPLEAAGSLAHLYYQSGNFDLARQWVTLADPTDIAAQWVDSKLLLRDGKLAEAEAVLARMTEALQEPDAHAPDEVASREPLPNVVEAELGAVRLDEDDYEAAMLAFLRAGYIDDAFYIADQVMTTDELAAFINAHAAEFTARSEDIEGWLARKPDKTLRYILARRYARAGQYDKAQATYPADAKAPAYGEPESQVALQTLISEYATALAHGHDAKAGKAERAESLFNAATIARESGMELFGTEQSPDWAVFEGTYEPWGETRAKAGTATPKEAERVAQNAPTPNRRFHYRWVASDLMWEAAQLLPDNDEHLAQALWYGGTWIEKSDPEGADKFYKALVRRCRNLPIGKAADEKRWFPDKSEEWDRTE